MDFRVVLLSLLGGAMVNGAAQADPKYYPEEWLVHEVPFLGVWAAEPAWCAYADKIGTHTPAPIKMTQTEILGYETTCGVTGFYKIAETNTWYLPLTCQSEGDTYEEERLVMYNPMAPAPETLWMWFGTGEPLAFTQCEATQ